jgi:hypothetical protein
MIRKHILSSAGIHDILENWLSRSPSSRIWRIQLMGK